MFRNKKEKEIDVTSLNHILRTGKKLMSIGYFMAILALIILGTFLIKEWKILGILKEFIIVISPIFIGFLVAWLFEPLVKKLQAKKVPRLLGCILSYLLILGVIFLIAYMFIPSLVTQIKDFVAAAPEIFKELTKFVTNIIEKFDTNHLINIKDVKKEITSIISNFGMGLVSNLPEYALSIGKSIINGGLNFVLGLMIGFYLLFDFDKVNENIDKILPKTWKENFRELTKRINTSLRSYVQGVLLVMFLVFLTQSIGLTLAGMEAPLLFALFCAVTDIIPYFGPYIGGIPAVIVGFTISPITGICVLISILVVQLLENNFYQPLIMGHTMQLHPVTIMLGLLIFEHFFGILGMVIATPVIACIKVLLIFVNEKTGIIESITGEEIADLKELEEN
ncbi:MAG: AI-2E family transporter [Mollicutes bacterium]|nr:AI-2E family transporter [Mollicutes bacterium]